MVEMVPTPTKNGKTVNVEVSHSNSIPREEQNVPIHEIELQSPHPPQKSSCIPCCGLIPLREATFLIAIFGIVTGCMIPVVAVAVGEIWIPRDPRLDPECEGCRLADFYTYFGTIILYPAILVILNVVLFAGAWKNRAGLCTIWVVGNFFNLFIWGFVGSLLFGFYKFVALPVFFPGIYFTIVVIMFILETRINNADAECRRYQPYPQPYPQPYQQPFSKPYPQPYPPQYLQHNPPSGQQDVPSFSRPQQPYQQNNFKGGVYPTPTPQETGQS